MKDREQRLGMADSPIEFEQTPVNAREFVVKAVTDVGGRVAHWSVSPATDIDRNLLVKDPAKVLSQVPVKDPNLRFSLEDFKNPTDETLSLAIPLFFAKEEQVRQERTLSSKEKRELGKARRLVSTLLGPKGRNTAAALAMLTAACSPAIIPPILEPTPTLAPITQETEVAPDLQEIDRPIESALVLDQEDLFENRPDIEAEFEKFKSLFLGLYGGTMPENVDLVAEGIYTTYLDGEDPTLHPLFSIESTNSDIPSLVNMLISIPNGDGTFTFKLIPLERGEWTNDQGVTWVTLSVTNHTRTDMPLADPLEVFAIRKDLVTNPEASVYWSPSGNALDPTRSAAFKVLAAIRETSGPSFESPLGEPNAEMLKTAINTPEGFWDGAEIQEITSTEELLNSLKEQGYEPILDSDGNLATIMTKDYARVSLLHLPESLHGGRELIVGQDDGVAFYGPSLGSEETTHVVSSVILSVFSNELFAITALDENNKLVVLLLDNAGTIYGEMRGEYQPNEILKQVWSPIGNQAKLKSQIVFFELYEDILLPEPSKWYEDLSQADLRNIVQTSERLYDDETIIPLSSVITQSTTQIASPQADFRGIVIDVPKIISLKLTDYEGTEMIRHVYVVPYLLQTRGGEFFIKEVIVGWYQTQRIPTTLANHHELNSGTNQSYSSLPAHTAISSLTPLTQHQLSSTWWMNESLDRSTLAEYPGDLEIFDSILMNKNFASKNSQFVQRFASGSGASQLESGYITIFLITYNVD